MVRRGPTHLQHLHPPPASVAAAATTSVNSASGTWCEHEHVTSVPPGRSIFIARRFSSLYPRIAPSAARFDFANAGGSSTIVSYRSPLASYSRSSSNASASIHSTCAVKLRIQLQIPVRHLQRAAARIHPRHPLAPLRQMNRKSALVRANIQRRTPPIPRRSRIVQPLIEKRSGLLARTRVVVKSQPIDREDAGKLRRITRPNTSGPGRRRSQLLQLPNLRIRPLHNGLRPNRSRITSASTARTSSCAVPCVSNCRITRSLYRSATIPGKPSASENTNRQASFSIDSGATSSRSASAATTRSRTCSRYSPRVKRRLRRHHPHRNLRRRAIKPRPQRNPAAIHHRNQRTTRNLRRPNRRNQRLHIRPINPKMPRPQPVRRPPCYPRRRPKRLSRNHSRPALFNTPNHESMVAQPPETSDSHRHSTPTNLK